MKLSVLDLVPFSAGETAADAIRGSVALARHVEALGFTRYWIAEHHDAGGLASSAPEVLIGHIAGHTERLRVGSGGIMLPNHASLHVAEIFRTLEAIYPGRIDLGVGRAPGSDRRASAALQRGDPEQFPQQVVELQRYFRDEMPVRAIPAGGTAPELWMLGSSDFGARLAGQLSLPYAFAQHFSRLDPLAVLALYRATFAGGAKKPYAALGCHVICAPTDAEAEELALSSDWSMGQYARTGRSEPLRSVEEARAMGMDRQTRLAVRELFPKFVGSPETVRAALGPLLPHADELIVTCMVHDAAARRRSYSLLWEAVVRG